MELRLIPTQGQLDACVTCGLCLPHCPTFRLTGDEIASPRGRITAMTAVANGQVASDKTFAEMMSFCLQCRACEAACPSQVPYGLMMEGVRAQLAKDQPSTKVRMKHLLVGKMLNMKWLMALSASFIGIAQKLRVARLLPGPLQAIRGIRPQRVFPHSVVGVVDSTPAAPSGTVALLAGCVMDEWFPEVHDASRGVLQMAGLAVSSPPRQKCCGALAAHEGAADDAKKMAAHNTLAFAGFDYLVADAAGCSAHLKEYGEWAAGGASVAERTLDITELVAQLIKEGRLPHLPDSGESVVVQDPCHARHVQGIYAEPRTIVRAAGYTPVDLDADALCCGAAGLYLVYEKGTSDRLGEMKAELVRGSGLATVVSANPGCEMQLRAHLNAGYRVLHPIELYWQALNADDPLT